MHPCWNFLFFNNCLWTLAEWLPCITTRYTIWILHGNLSHHKHCNTLFTSYGSLKMQTTDGTFFNTTCTGKRIPIAKGACTLILFALWQNAGVHGLECLGTPENKKYFLKTTISCNAKIYYSAKNGQKRIYRRNHSKNGKWVILWPLDYKSLATQLQKSQQQCISIAYLVESSWL